MCSPIDAWTASFGSFEQIFDASIPSQLRTADALKQAWTPAMETLASGADDEATTHALLDMLPRTPVFQALFKGWAGTHRRLVRGLR